MGGGGRGRGGGDEFEPPQEVHAHDEPGPLGEGCVCVCVCVCECRVLPGRPVLPVLLVGREEEVFVCGWEGGRRKPAGALVGREELLSGEDAAEEAGDKGKIDNDGNNPASPPACVCVCVCDDGTATGRGTSPAEMDMSNMSFNPLARKLSNFSGGGLPSSSTHTRIGLTRSGWLWWA